MVKPVIVKRQTKGSPLTYSELDTNFQNLDDATINFTGDAGDTRSMDLNDTTSITGSRNIKITVDEATQNIKIDNTLSDYTQEPMGFENRTDSTISFSKSTRTFSIQPASAQYRIWVKGVPYIKTGTDSVSISATAGIYYIYWDDTGTLQSKTTFFTLKNEAPVAYVYWNGTDAVYFADERHGITLDWATHEYLHRTRGAAYATGFAISNYTILGDGSLDSHAQLDVADGTFYDEDIPVSVTHSNSPTANTWQQDLQGPARIPVFYRDGSTWYITSPTDFPVKFGTRIQYNEFALGAWTAQDVPTTEYVAYWLCATNNLNYPVVTIMGQRSDNKLTDAQSFNLWTDLDLTGFPSLEFRPLWRLIYRTATGYTNSVKGYLADVQDIRLNEIRPAGSVSTGITQVSDDLSPSLGGDLDVNGFRIISTSAGNIVLDPDSTGVIELAGPVKVSATAGSPTTFENGYYEDMLQTPVSWLKITIGASDYYIPLFQ